MEFLTERDSSPLGVTRQVQQEINSSCGSKPYTLTQMLPLAVLPWAPEFEKLITESPMLRLAAYLTWNASAGPSPLNTTMDALHIPVGGGGGILAMTIVQPGAVVVAVS